MKRIELLLDSNRGIYIPRDFTQMIKWSISAEDRVILQNPDHEYYWESWEHVLNTSKCTLDGYTWTLHQDGDLWAIRSDLYNDTESQEYKAFFGNY